MADTFLERIVASTRADLEERKRAVPPDAMRARALVAPAPRGFADALRPGRTAPARVIAEVKRASPSKGMLAETYDPVAQAVAYERGGAAAVSVLTEPHYFLGSLEHLTAVRHAVSIPVLRKDFTLDSYQVYEARAAGADAILLICAMLDDATLTELMTLAHDLGMAALVEAHNGDEVRRAVASDASIIGVNSRDLRTFDVDTDTTRRLRAFVPPERTFIAESGIASPVDAARARAWGADAVLVGESLMRASDPVAHARALASAPGGMTAALFSGTGDPFLKLCGLKEPEHARLAAELGADAAGVVFAPQAPDHRRVNVQEALRIADALSGNARAGKRPLLTGVFVNPDLDKLETLIKDSHLDAVQLSGGESPEICARIIQRTGVPVVKALRLRGEAELEALDAYALAGAALLLDAFVPGSYGGAGVTGDWELARRAAQRWPVILSGGLHPENVRSAVAHVLPRGVDVSSGIETAKHKDPEKMRAFVAAARGAGALESSDLR